jgi:hypothetical protein
MATINLLIQSSKNPATILPKVQRATILITFLVEIQTPMRLSTIFQTALNTKRIVIFSFQST